MGPTGRLVVTHTWDTHATCRSCIRANTKRPVGPMTRVCIYVTCRSHVKYWLLVLNMRPVGLVYEL